MESKRRIILILVVAAGVILASLPCSLAQDNNDQDGRRREGQRMERPGGSPGGRSGERGEREGRGGSGDRTRGDSRPGRADVRRWPELTNEQIDSILGELTKRDPNTAKGLAELRKTDLNEFRSELLRVAGPRIIMQSWDNRRRKEFLEWIEKYVPNEAEELARLKEKEPELYTQKYRLTLRRWGRIYDRTRRNPEFAKVLVLDVQLSERESELIVKYKAAEGEDDKNELMAQLDEVASDRYDLIVRQKQMEYEQLLRRLEALQNQVKASIEEIKIYRTDEFKDEKIKERMKELTEERKRPQFDWRDRR